MSTGLECVYVRHPETKKWYYVLQNWDCPAQCWDWREYATCYGPFDTEDEAWEHLRRTQPNPGGSSTLDFSKDDTWFDNVFKGLMEGATTPRRF